MAAVELTTEHVASWSGKEILRRTGTGATYPSIGDWLVDKQKAGISVLDVSTSVAVIGIDHWVAFNEKRGNEIIQTVFEIT